MTETPLLEAAGLTLGYGDSEIVKDVSFKARLGSITAIVGPNGSGKTTLLRGLAGLLPAKRGSLHFSGVDITGVDTAELVRQGLGYVPQLKNVFANLTIRENLEIGAATCRKQLRQRTEHVVTLFPDLGVDPGKQAGALSGGQRNMLALARALMTAPSLLLVDEPTAGLSPKFSSAVWRHLGQVVATGVGVVIVEQNTRAALQLARDACLLVNGSLIFSGPASELAANKELAHAYLGGQAR
jgi:ABC-type branched-subunit amino acid transport system ATPase component